MASQRHHFLMRVLIPLVIVLVVAWLVPLEMPVGMDISQAILSARSVLNGGDIYGLGVSQVATDAQNHALSGSLPYPGPPWSFPPLIILGLLSPERAAALWFILSVVCLAGAIAVVTVSLSPALRASIVIAALISAPVQGHLIVGQMTIIALLGVAVLLAGHRRASWVVMGIGLSLLSFRPHLGLPVVVVAGLYLLVHEPRRFLLAATWATAIVLCLGVLAVVVDPTCLRAYPELMVALNSLPSNKVCDTCSSLPVLLTDRSPTASDSVWTERFILAGVSVPALGYPLLRWGKSLAVVVSGAVCVSLLSAPYNRNYDFVLLLVPLIIIGRRAWALGACRIGRARIALGLIATGAVIGGVLPYFVSRTVQGDILWLSALLGYVGALLVAQGPPEPKIAVLSDDYIA